MVYRVLWFLLATTTICRAQDLTVAAASDLNYALRVIAQEFESETGKKVNLTFGSSGTFFTAIQNGAPYDVFFSADIDYPKKLEAAGLTVAGTVYEYAIGKIVLWVPATSKLDVTRGLNVLREPSIRKIAIANPRHAPYGRAAVAALQKAGLYDSAAPRFVVGENISQTAQFAESGNADIGIIALSLAMAPPLNSTGRYQLIPVDSYPPIQQAAVVLNSAKDKGVAQKFLQFVKSPRAAQVFARYGFALPRPIAP